MDLDAAHAMQLSGHELMLLRAGLKAHLRAFGEHRELDRGASHPEEEWQRLQRQIGELIWRLEEAGAPPGTTLIHSEEAVDPAAEAG